MKFKTITTTAAVLTILNALFFFFLPNLSLMLLERSTNQIGIMNTQIAGACALGLGVMTWCSRDTKSREVQKIVFSGNLSAFGLLIIADLQGVTEGAINHFGWLILIADVLIFLGFIGTIFTFRGNKE
jgi:hypothetical protein